MELKIVIAFLALVVLGLVYYLVNLGFAEMIKWLAKKQILCTYLKENRVMQIDDGEKFNEFILTKRGYSFAFQLDENQGIDWEHERDRWQIVPNKHYNFEDSLTGFQEWCLKELGIYWFGGWLLGKKVRVREVDLYSYDHRSSELQQIEKKSPYLFATETMYAWEIRNAEDVTGNSFRIEFGVIASVVNPYIAWIENERWDKTFAAKAISSPIPFIKGYPFHVLSPQIQKSVEELKNSTANNDVSIPHDEIAEKFGQKVLDALKMLTIGLEFKSVELFNVDPENPEVFKGILDYYQARYKSESAIEIGRGEAAALAQKLKVERDDLRERLAAMDTHPESARLSTLKETFKNVTVLGGDQLTLLIDPDKKAK